MCVTGFKLSEGIKMSYFYIMETMFLLVLPSQ